MCDSGNGTKKRRYQISCPDMGGGWVVLSTLEEVKEFLEEFFESGDIEDSYIVKCVEMTDRAVENLPEWGGF